MPGQVDIVLPGLFDLPLHELDPSLVSQRLPGLNRVLRLASPRSNRAYSIDSILRQVLRLGNGAPAGLPLAQSCAPRETAEPGRLLVFKAVHLRADMQSAIVMPIVENDRNIEDIVILIKDLSELFKADCVITSLADGLYLMNLEENEAPTHYPHILSVLGKTANPYIEQMRQDLTWYRLVNEMQMFLYQHEVNQERARQGLLPINSLWFWGGGEPPEQAGPRLAWYCDDALLNRFAERLQLSPSPLERLAESPPSGDAAIVDLRLLEMLKTGVQAGLEEALLDIDRRLLRPLLEAPKRLRQALLLRAGYDYDYYLPPAAGWKFWRRPRSLADWTAGNDGL